MKKKILSLMLSLAISIQCLCFTVNAETGTDSIDGIRTIAIDFSDKNDLEVELYEGEQVQLVLPHDADEYKVNYVNYYSEDNHIAVSQDLKVVGCYAGAGRVSIYVGYEFDPYYRDEIEIKAAVMPNETISAENGAELERINKLGYGCDNYLRRKMELLGVIDENAPRLDMEKIQEIIDSSDSYLDILAGFNMYHSYPDVIAGASGNTPYIYWFDPKGNEAVTFILESEFIAYTKIADDGTVVGVQGLYPEKTEFYENGKDKDYDYIQYNQIKPKGNGTLNLKFIDESTGEPFTDTNGKFQLISGADDKIIKSWDASEGREITISDLPRESVYELRYIDDYHGESPDKYRYEIDLDKGTNCFSFGYDTELSYKVYLRKRYRSDPHLIGDVNSDNRFNVADVVTLQRWLLGKPDTVLMNWRAADLCADGVLNVFDLCLIKRELINQVSE